jgi:hypothetical protein
MAKPPRGNSAFIDVTVLYGPKQNVRRQVESRLSVQMGNNHSKGRAKKVTLPDI